jgi:hypothetical protein
MSWWPFSKRFSRVDEASKINLPIPLPDDLSSFANNNGCIKLWLPEKLVEGLDTLSSAHGMSRPDVLRWVMFEHVYGRPALEKLKEWKRQKDKEDAERREADRRRRDAEPPSGAQYSLPRFSPQRVSERTYTARLLGKSVEDFKLWLPTPLKGDLEALASAEDLGLSDYIRKTLVRILLGESFHHQWRKAVGKLPDEVRRFEQEE